jgi:hypothetical protein
LCHWKKNLNVRSRPITQARPDRNKICHKKGVVIYVISLKRLHVTDKLRFRARTKNPCRDKTANPHHLDADPKPNKENANLQPLTYRPSTSVVDPDPDWIRNESGFNGVPGSRLAIWTRIRSQEGKNEPQMINLIF